jgi:GTPase
MERGPKSGGAGAPPLAAVAEGLAVVVLVGRANAGKSTLFNRIVRGNRAITSAIPGTTRDLNIAIAEHQGRRFALVDSGGLELGGREPITARVVEEALRAVAASDAVVFILDSRAGLSAADSEALALIRESGRQTVVAVNKVDRPADEAGAAEFYSLGAEHLFLISAAHGRGIEELLDEVIARLPAIEDTAVPPPDLRVALIGRPNVGKSSLLNRMAGYGRAIVDETPGTTRDTVDVRVKVGERNLLLIDTAGIRRPTRVSGELEHHSVARAIETIRRAEVLALVIDATEGVTDQDARLARLVENHDRALILVVNKWDAAAKLNRRIPAFIRDLRERYPFLGFAPVLFTSALTGDGVGKILPRALEVGRAFRATFQTSQLNRILAEATAAMDPPLIDRHRLNLMYVTQIAGSPPRFRFFSNLERDIPAHYVRFLETRFREALELSGTPLRFEFRRAPGHAHARPKPARRPQHRGPASGARARR